jgi:uncharacterized membrane protein
MGWCVAAPCAVAQTFDLVGAPGVNGVTRIHGISADGTVAAGYSATAGTPFTWTRAGGRVDLPFPASAFAISGDGTTIAGQAFPSAGVAQAFRYSAGSGQQLLGAPGPFPRSQANGVNGDGNVIAGEAFNSVGTQGVAWRWTPAGGMQPLGHTRVGHTVSAARAVSRDGQTIVGFSGGGGVAEAFRWTATGGLQALPDQPGTVFSASASAVNHDGSIIVGNSGLPGNPPAIWRGDDLPTILPIPAAWANAGGNVVSDDGSIVAGEARNPNFEQEAWIWTQSRGSESLFSYLTSQGVNIPGGWRLSTCTGISADGRTFAGYASELATAREIGFVATVPTPGAVVTVLAALLATSRRKR